MPRITPMAKRFYFLFLLSLSSVALSGENSPVARDLGIPIEGVSWARLHAGQTAQGEPSLLATMSQTNGGLFVVNIDTKTGRSTKFNRYSRSDREQRILLRNRLAPTFD